MKNLFQVFTKKEIMIIVTFIAIVILAPLVLFIQATNTSGDAKENQGYLRYIACVIDVRNSANAITIPVAQLDKCWSIAEQQVGIKLPRYYNLVK